jgi:hypothetical protein
MQQQINKAEEKRQNKFSVFSPAIESYMNGGYTNRGRYKFIGKNKNGERLFRDLSDGKIYVEKDYKYLASKHWLNFYICQSYFFRII